MGVYLLLPTLLCKTLARRTRFAIDVIREVRQQVGEDFAPIIRLKPTAYDFDLVAVGRPILADSNWVTKLKTGRTSELKGFSKETLSELIPE